MNAEKMCDLIAVAGRLDAVLFSAGKMAEDTEASKLNTTANRRFLEMVYMAVDQMEQLNKLIDSFRAEREVR
ncbi:MAG: hypothetical protein HFF62_03970 [Oscillospiraceae bacterium]|nr:hypothetical protein [Oscillospiraceae bacterium]